MLDSQSSRSPLEFNENCRSIVAVGEVDQEAPDRTVRENAPFALCPGRLGLSVCLRKAPHSPLDSSIQT